MSDIPDNLQGLAEYLQLLGLPDTKIPTLEETRRAYKALLKNHPDKNLDSIDESTKAFQSIQEAYRIVSFFLADYCNHKDVSSGSSHQEEDELLLNMLASKNRLKFNKDSVTFVLDNNRCEAWISSIETKVNVSREAIVDKNKKTIGYKMKNDKVKVPYTGVNISVTISIWPNPSDGVSKMLIQGRGYWSFIMCILPSVIRSMNLINDAMINSSLSITSDSKTSADKSPITTSTGSFPNVGVTAKLSDAIVKMEKAVIDLGTNLGNRMTAIEDKVNKIQASCPSSSIVSKLTDSVNSLSGTLSSSVTEIKSSCASVSSLSVQLSESDVENISNKVVASTSQKLKESINESNKSVDSKLTTLSSNINKVENEMSTLNKNLAGLPTLVTSLQKLIDKPESGIMKQQDTDLVSRVSLTDNENEPEISVDHATSGPKVRKGAIFTTSLGKSSDIKRLEKELNSKLDLFVTYHIEDNTWGAEDNSLQSKVEQVMSREYDFAILQLGSNEMSNLDLSLSRKELFQIIQNDCEKLISVAKDLVQKYDIEVFVSEKPPRYDQKVEESAGLLEDLNSTSNSVIRTHTLLLDKVHCIRQSMLECKNAKTKNERYMADGIHLTERGVSLLNTNWIDQIRKVFTDLSNVDSTRQFRQSENNFEQRRGRGNQHQTVHHFNSNYGWGDDRSNGYRRPRQRGQYPGVQQFRGRQQFQGDRQFHSFSRGGGDRYNGGYNGYDRGFRGNRRGNQNGRNDLLDEMIAAYIQRDNH